jgi:hypothetical protein
LDPPDSRITVSDPEKQSLLEDVEEVTGDCCAPVGDWIGDVGLPLGMDVGALGVATAALLGETVVDEELTAGIVTDSIMIPLASLDTVHVGVLRFRVKKRFPRQFSLV